MNIHLIVMAKAPVAGFAKTRLVPPLTHDQAAGLAEAMLCDMLARPWPGFARHLCVSGASARFVEAEAAGWQLSQQAAGDLGVRLDIASRAAFDAGAEAVAFLGTDAPDLPDSFLSELRAALADGADLVIGPATDGGYYTIATRSHQACLYADMPWSQPGLFDATIAAAAKAGLRTHRLPAWSDMDEVADLVRFAAGNRPSEASPHLAPRTLARVGALASLLGGRGGT